MSISKLCLLTIISSFILSTCIDPNCLVCENQICALCNISNLYYLQNNVCQKYDGFHCKVINSIGNCLECENGFLLIDQNSCVYVHNRVPNCMSYEVLNGDIICETCRTGFHRTRDQCFPNIQNCLNYQFGRNRCTLCQTGFDLSGDMLSCLIAPVLKTE